MGPGIPARILDNNGAHFIIVEKSVLVCLHVLGVSHPWMLFLHSHIGKCILTCPHPFAYWLLSIVLGQRHHEGVW